MESDIYKNSNLIHNKNNEEKYNKFNEYNKKNNQKEQNKNNIFDIQQKNEIIKNKKEDDNEIIIELEIINVNDKEINILCDKNKLIEFNKLFEEFDKKNNREPKKIFDYFNQENTKLYVNNNEISFKYKLKLNKIGINIIKIISKVELLTLSSMFYYCNNIKTIKFIKLNTNNITDMSDMFYNCKNLSNLDLSSFNTKNVTNMRRMFACCKNLLNLDLSSFNTNNVNDMSYMFTNCENFINKNKIYKY